MVLMIAYDLHQPGRDYARVEQVLKSADGGWAHPQGSVWIVDTSQATVAWRDRLRATMDPTDEILVTRLAMRDWAGWNMGQAVVEWLNDPRRRW